MTSRMTSTLPAQLRALPSDTEDVSGPIDTSNWVIPGRLIAGSYPGSILEEKHSQVIRDIVITGVTTFVCLLDVDEHNEVPPYESVAQDIASEYGRSISIIHFPIPGKFVINEHYYFLSQGDMKAAKDDDALLEFIPKLASVVESPNEVVYVHCWGGHGRTGIIISLLLVALYQLESEQALHLTELYHSKRVKARLHSPQTTVQFDQVRRLAERLRGMLQAPSLPPLPSDDDDVRGPIEVSNWVIPSRLVAGGYPGSSDPVKHKETVERVMKCGVTHFVCLMPNYELERFTPYQEMVKEIAAREKRKINFTQFPIEDCCVPDDDALLEFIPKLASVVESPNEVVYVHCWGGHGRTGVIISLLLVALYQLESEQALRLTKLYHSKRVRTNGQNSPQTVVQFEQVNRLSKNFLSK